MIAMPTVWKVELERKHVAITEVRHPDEYAYGVETMTMNINKNLVFQLRAWVESQPLDSVTFSWPATLFEAIKERFAPRWYLKRWPVRRESKRYEMLALYGALVPPDHRPTVIYTCWEEGKP